MSQQPPPDRSDRSDQTDDRQRADEQDTDAGGQVSEVASMDAADPDTPISDSQSVLGQPDQESGEVQEEPGGPR